MTTPALSWIEISQSAIQHNMNVIRQVVGPNVQIMVPVKANAYGHGIAITSQMMAEAGADWFAVHSLQEALELHSLQLHKPILILGYVPLHELKWVIQHDFHLTLLHLETALQIEQEALQQNKTAKVHIKLETGTNRQGNKGDSLSELASYVNKSPSLSLEGLSMHFANIEDTTDHRFAESQIQHFRSLVAQLKEQNIQAPFLHTASSAATLLFPETHFTMVRPGISSYGLWPSKEAYVSLLINGKAPFQLQPVLAWKTIVHQIKMVPKGETIGYGCTYKTTRDTLLGILPVGYYDGLDRRLSNSGYVLIKGQRAPIRGRICMNLSMIDLTDIEGVQLEEEVVLLGKQGEDEISAETLASMMGTIHYECIARINPLLPRKKAK